MLLPSQVLPFLQHREKPVRDLALRYLSRAHDPSPATAEDVWKLIDKFGAGERGRLYYSLAVLPQTEQSVERTVKAIESIGDEEARRLLESVLAQTNYGMLVRTRDVIETSSAISPEARTDLARRLELAQVPRNELLDRLTALADECDKRGEVPEDAEFRSAERLTEALARHPESAPWAISTLNDEQSVGKWIEIWAVDLLGRMKFRPAAELIVNKLAEDDEMDVMTTSAVQALVHIGSADVVRQVRERYGKLDEGSRMSCAEIVGRIKLPQSEQTLLAMLNAETHRTVRTQVADAMCELCVTEPASLAKIREMVNANAWDITMTDLDEVAAALFTVVGNEIPELARWRSQAATGARVQARKKAYNELFGGGIRTEERAENDVGIDQMTWDEDVPPWEAPQPTSQQKDAAVPIAPKTIRREVPKVGRNDPCPCGSGKKYKKCCGK